MSGDGDELIFGAVIEGETPLDVTDAVQQPIAVDLQHGGDAFEPRESAANVQKIFDSFRPKLVELIGKITQSSKKAPLDCSITVCPACTLPCKVPLCTNVNAAAPFASGPIDRVQLLKMTGAPLMVPPLKRKVLSVMARLPPISNVPASC